MRFEEDYRGYRLDGIPFMLSHRRWTPRLVVTDQRSSQHVDHTFALPGVADDYATAVEAAAAALTVGRKWVDDQA